MREDLTVIYVTSNRENPEFESRIQKSLLDAVDGTPIISVSQKPTALGHNICIGDVGASPQNVLRQMITGARASTTRYVAIAEADFLYPREFFEFVPRTDDTFYYPDNVYILWVNHSRFFKKHLHEMLSVTAREHFITTLETVASQPFTHIVTSIGRITKQGYFHTEVPLVTFKTRNGMHWKSKYVRRGSRKELPQWGSVTDLVKKFCEGS
jgi:hypothetical protein